MKLILGSTSRLKFQALYHAFLALKRSDSVIISCVATSSGQNEQPVGFEETYQGALTRAQAAQKHIPTSVGVGIENGIFRFSDVTIDMAIIVLVKPNGDRIVASSPGFVLPEPCVEIAKNSGFAITTVGSVIAESYGGNPADPHTTLSNGMITRRDLLIEGLVIALKQL